VLNIFIKNIIDKIKLNLFLFDKLKPKLLSIVNHINFKAILILPNKERKPLITPNKQKLNKIQKHNHKKQKNTMMNNAISNVVKKSNNKKNKGKNKKFNN
jgi:hypothetical protein